MRKVIATGVFAFIAVLLSYGSASAQIVEKTKEVTKDVAEKTKDVTVGAATKTKVIVTDGLAKTADGTEKAAKVGPSKTQKFGNNAVNVTENVVGQTYEGGKYFTVTTWDGAKWVSKRVWHPNKKAEN